MASLWAGYPPTVRIRRVPGLASSVVLAGVTLGAFATFRNYGPESAIRRFHHAALTNDPREMAAVVDVPGASAVQELRLFATVAQRGGGGFRVVKSEGNDDEVKMVAFYANGLRGVWVVRKGRDRWRIASFDTLQALRNVVGGQRVPGVD